MPLMAEGEPKGKTFLYGVFSGIVEPIGAMLVVGASTIFVPAMPYLLSFFIGFIVMMVLDVALG